MAMTNGHRTTALRMLAGFAAASFLAGPALAQSAIGEMHGGAMHGGAMHGGESERPGRYEIVRIDGVVARLDTATGQLASCRVAAETIRCGKAPAAGEPQPFEARIRALERRVSALESELAEGGSALTGSDETDIAIERMQKLFRGFADIVKELEEGREDGAKPLPNRT
ncbi:hypothetical protein E3C22_20385 [Jiella endophytica]|uniref:Uncharacterized protein n=1 Tax=Jiella endophytica TaxID=2558362 RepID=A0A4Y8RBE9_9HYPH|nr:hypothetical protein [Jiella endophytica]TFF19132.1 hypothetical protein E3C22_20385 [Jiella endophytica]